MSSELNGRQVSVRIQAGVRWEVSVENLGLRDLCAARDWSA